MAQVVTRFLKRLGANGSELRVTTGLQLFPHQHHQRAVQKIANDGDRVVALTARSGRQRGAVWQLQQGVVAELAGIAKIGKCIFAGAFTLQRGGILVEQARLADQVQGIVGQCQVFFQNRAVAAPFGVALAQHQGVVSQVQDIVR